MEWNISGRNSLLILRLYALLITYTVVELQIVADTIKKSCERTEKNNKYVITPSSDVPL